MENQNNVVNEEVNENIETTESVEVEVKTEKTFTQEELDKILNKKFAQWQKKTEEAKLEAERRAKLTEAEKLVNERLKGNTPKSSTSKGNSITKEQFSKMGLAERQKLYTENRELYNKLSQR